MNPAMEMKYSYLLAALGVALTAVIAVFDSVRALMFRPAFRQGFNGTRQFANPMGFGFGFGNGLLIVAVVIALVGIVWLGLALRKQPGPGASSTPGKVN